MKIPRPRITNEPFSSLEREAREDTIRWTMNLPPGDDKWSTHLRFRVRRVPPRLLSSLELSPPSHHRISREEIETGSILAVDANERFTAATITMAHCA